MSEQRGSGRTTRMLMRATIAASEGEHVIVVLQNVSHLSMARDIVHRLLPDVTFAEGRNRLKVGEGKIEFITASSTEFDWIRGEVRGCNGPVFADHLVEEVRPATFGVR